MKVDEIKSHMPKLDRFFLKSIYLDHIIRQKNLGSVLE